MTLKKFIYKNSKFALIAIMLLAMAACVDIYDRPNDEECPINKAGTFITLTINTPLTTRSTPTGGENGDAVENGQTNENIINNLSVFFFQGTDINQAIETNAPIAGTSYFESSDIIGNTTKTRKVNIPKGTYHVIVAANAGNLTSTFGTTAKVKDVCDYLQKQAWTESNGNYSQFVMSSANDASTNISASNSESSPAQIYVDIERLAARIDFIPSKSTDATDLNNYLVKDASNKTIARVIINKIKLINRFTAGSYLIKRVAETTSSTLNYLGNEKSDINGVQTNYVLDPWTVQKTKENLNGQHFNLLNGGSGTDAASSLYASYYNGSFSMGVEDKVKNSNLTYNGTNYYILGYSLENTTDKINQLNGYTTGVMFETTYIPYLITNYDPSSHTNQTINNSNAITFFTYNNGDMVCNSLEAVEFASLKSGQPADDFFAQTFTSVNTWQDVLQYFNRIKDNDPLGFKTYLSLKLSGKSLSANLTETISWKSFILSTYGYSNSGGVVYINQNSKPTQLLLSEKNIRCYENGISYYPYWIRHSNNSSTEAGVMEFSIVRNNIYKLKVNSFSGAGKFIPYDPGTDSPENPGEESSIRMFVSVTPWRVITHPEIIL
ncbi:Mfa1 family fimbria major subunit [Bacteroides sedimenti]|uniref:Fimbrial subunit protein C-terminal domain-containing protein n=1 Tax=Bacteroides sedimenti TaxID=2136147 RepID=A0ABN6Z9J2_9BACE